MQERELHVRDYLRILYRRKWPALAVFVITFAVAVIRSVLAPPAYRATTRILIEKTEVQNLAIPNPMYSSWDPEFYRTQVQIILSEATAERAARLVAADEHYRRRAARSAGRGTAAPAGDAVPPALTRMIQGGLSASPEKESKIVVVSYLAPEPELAAVIVNAVVKAYMEQLFEMKTSYSRYAVEWMTEKSREERTRLEDAERSLQSFMKANDLITAGKGVAGMPERLSELGLELTRAETRRRELETVYKRLKAVATDPSKAETIPAVQADPGFQALRAQILKAEQNVAELTRKYGQKHPAMIAAREEVEDLRRKKGLEIQRIADSLGNEYELAVSREQDLRGLFSSGRGEALAASEKLVRYEELKRAVETNRQFYDTLMSHAKEESLTQQLQGVQVWTLEQAQVPRSPSGPHASRTILLGLVVGLVGAIGMAFFAEYLDNTVRTAEDLEVKTGVPVLGVIPLARIRGKEIEKAVLREPRTATAESYKALRTSILLSSAEGPPKSILVTSTAPEEGKTATAVNLAVAIAQSGYSVLLVDADLRKPRVDKIFDLPNDRGLSTLLSGVEEEPAFADVGIENLAILTSGPVPPNPSELLGSKRMDAVLRRLRGLYDILIFDSPPFLTVSDGLVLGKKLHAVIFVTRAERSTYEGVRRGVKALRDIDVLPLGLVLNAYDEKRIGAYYYHHYDYYGSDAEQGKPKSKSSRRAGKTAKT